MGTGIMICGLNGVGKNTLGRALAKKLNFYFIDAEHLYFFKTNPQDIYTSSRTPEEAGQLLFSEIKAHNNFVFASVTGDYGESFYPLFQYVVLLDVPKDVRVERVKNRSYLNFGDRMLPGGDLHEQEESFIHFVESRGENVVEEWVKSLSCPIVRVDGTKAIDENVEFIIKQIQRQILVRLAD